MSIYYVTNKKPLSHNKRGSNDRYKIEFQNEFNEKYAHLYTEYSLPLSEGTLKSCIVYIHQCRPGTIPDVDNLSKPIVDAFTGIIYEDDGLIVKRSAVILKLADFDFSTVDATDMPLEILEAFDEYYTNKEENIILFGVDTIELNTIKVGEI